MAFDLQRAVEQAPLHATIQVPPGEHSASLVVRVPVVLKGVQGKTVLKGSGNSPITIVGPATSAVRIEDCTLQSLRGDVAPAVQVEGGALIMERCTLSSREAAGAVVSSGGSLHMIDCVIGNTYDFGILLIGRSNAMLSRLRISGFGQEYAGTYAETMGAGSAGVMVADGSYAQMEHCEIKNGTGSGISVKLGCSVDLAHCEIHSCSFGIVLPRSSVVPTNCMVYGNRFEDIGYR
jgi:hypothetical protein